MQTTVQSIMVSMLMIIFCVQSTRNTNLLTEPYCRSHEKKKTLTECTTYVARELISPLRSEANATSKWLI